MEVSQKTKSGTTIWPSNSTPGYVSEKNKNTNSKRYMHSIIHSSIILVFDTHQCQKSLSLSEVPQLCSQGEAVPEATRVISDTSLGTELTGQEGKSPFFLTRRPVKAQIQRLSFASLLKALIQCQSKLILTFTMLPGSGQQRLLKTDQKKPTEIKNFEKRKKQQWKQTWWWEVYSQLGRDSVTFLLSDFVN